MNPEDVLLEEEQGILDTNPRVKAAYDKYLPIARKLNTDELVGLRIATRLATVERVDVLEGKQGSPIGNRPKGTRLD